MVGTAIILLWLDLRLGLVSLLCFPFLWWLTRWFRKESAIAYRRTRETVAVVIVHFVETVNGMRAVQAFRRQDRNQEIFDDVDDDYRAANERAFRLVGVFMPGIKLIGNVTLAVVLALRRLPGLRRRHHGRGARCVPPLPAAVLRPDAGRLAVLQHLPVRLRGPGEALRGARGGALGPRAEAQPTPLSDAEGALSLQSVQFAYVEGRPVLPNITLDIPAGQTIAVVGTTGAGKTTLAKLVARFYDPDGGQITLDGVDLRLLSEDDLRSVDRHGDPGELPLQRLRRRQHPLRQTRRRRARRSSRRPQAIGAHDFIIALPDGYDTDVANRGGRLSAGQRQLVAFARAFLADPAVLILDEATSSLDVPSERLVQRALRTILSRRTAIIIAHRLSTVEIADRVLVMEHGEVVEDGAPQDLIDTHHGRFSDLHDAWLASLA